MQRNEKVILELEYNDVATLLYLLYYYKSVDSSHRTDEDKNENDLKRIKAIIVEQINKSKEEDK